MAVKPSDLMEPRGLVTPDMFPEDSKDDNKLSERLAVYIQEGESNQSGTPLDTATKAWAYYRAFLAVYNRMSALPQSVSANEEGGHMFVQVQAERFKTMSEEYYAIWTNLIDDEVPIHSSAPFGSVKTVFTW